MFDDNENGNKNGKYKLLKIFKPLVSQNKKNIIYFFDNFSSKIIFLVLVDFPKIY